MSRRVTHDGRDTLQVRFPFDRGLVDRVKGLPGRRWDAGRRAWLVPVSHVLELVALLRSEGFAFDAATRELNLRAGGDPLPEDDAGPGPRLPGLFDDPPAPEGPAPPPATVEHLTVSRLNERVRERIQSAFPLPVWIVGEISGFNKGRHRRHVGFELVERSSSGATVSKVPATLFEATRREVERVLADAGDPFRLEDEITVRLRVRVELYVPWGQYRVVVEELDVAYTLGEAARRREEIVRRLAEAGLLERNRALPLPAFPLRVGLITSLGSDACNDVLRTLQESGWAFDVTVHGARVQGHATEPSVLNALDWFAARADRFDALLICRGGGSRTDLVWFDTETLGRTVARFPIPVLVGIGHEQDRSVLDEVGRSCKTPTAAAAALVETVAASAERIMTRGREVARAARTRVEREAQRGRERGRRLAVTARSLLDREQTVLTHRRDRLRAGSGSLVRGAGQSLTRVAGSLPGAATRVLDRRRMLLATLLRSVVQGARRDVDAARERLVAGASAVGPRGLRAVERERERLEAKARRLELADPDRVVARGYAILRLADGRVVTGAAMAPAGTSLTARLRDGSMKLRSEGEGGD